MAASIPANPAGNQGKPEPQAQISCGSQIVTHGLDTVHLTFALILPDTVLNDLRAAKQAIQDGESDSALWKFGQTNLFSWSLSRTGIKLFPFFLSSGDLTLALSGRKADSRIPNAKLCIGSMSSNNNPGQLLDTIKKWFALHGIQVKRETVARADLFADYAEEIGKLHLISQARMVTRAEKVAYYYSNRKLTGVQVGTSSIVLRMYDKIQEMADKRATAKQEFFASLWGGQQTAITRVEFQVRRDALREFWPESLTFAELVEGLPSLWRYLTEDWFRHTARAVDRANNNQSRETTSEFWQQIQAAFDLPAEKADRKKHLKVFNLQALTEQAGGIMATIAAGIGCQYDDLISIMAAMQDFIGGQVQKILAEKGERDFYRRAAVCCVNV